MRRQGSNAPATRGMTGQVSSAIIKRDTRNISEHREITDNQAPNINPSGRLLGYKQNVLVDQTNFNKEGLPIKGQTINVAEINYMDPSENIQLDQNELEEIFSRAYMDPNFAKYGHKPNSN